jgi:hypothetical protein
MANKPALDALKKPLFQDFQKAALSDGILDCALHDEPGHPPESVSTSTAPFWAPFQKTKFYFFKCCNPIRCGLMKHHLYSRLLELRFQGSQEQVQQMTWLAHLYVAEKLLEPQEPRWPDMEFVLQRQGLVYLFRGDG